jgi:anti-sigma regulatory factor (Ser/Thr protein kinase)
MFHSFIQAVISSFYPFEFIPGITDLRWLFSFYVDIIGKESHMSSFYTEISSTFEAVDSAVDSALTFLDRQCRISDASLAFKINFILRELLINAVEHGNRMDAGKKAACRISYDAGKLNIEVSDEGGGFKCKKVSSGDNNSVVLELRGRGISTIRNLGADFNVKKNHVFVKLNIDKHKAE